VIITSGKGQEPGFGTYLIDQGLDRDLIAALDEKRGAFFRRLSTQALNAGQGLGPLVPSESHHPKCSKLSIMIFAQAY